MPTLKALPFAPLSAYGLSEKDAVLYESTRFDGLQPTQIVRRWDSPGHGLSEEAQALLAARLDASADADRAPATTDDLGLQGARRYVANPLVEGVQYPGLWVGGPLEVQFDRNVPDRAKRTLFAQQTLTLVHHVGTWTVADDGTVTLADGTPDLTKLRPAYKEGSGTETPYDGQWPDTDTLEIVWRHFTHESKAALLAATPAQLFGQDPKWEISAREFRIEPETNAGVLTVTAVAKTVYDVEDEDDLADMPHKNIPVERVTVRNWGLKADTAYDAPQGGRGFVWTFGAEWKNISRESRENLCYVVDCEELAVRLFGTDLEWRCGKKEVVEQNDGLLGFKVTWWRPDHANNGTARATVETRAPSGWGRRTTALVPTVPLGDVENVLDGLVGPTGDAVNVRTATENREEGYADLHLETEAGWGYATGDMPPDLPVLQGIEAPTVEYQPGVCTGGGGYVAVYRNVRPDAVASVVDKASSAVVPATSGAVLRRVRVEQAENGLSTITAESSTEKYDATLANLISSDWFTWSFRQVYDGVMLSADDTWVAADTGLPVSVLDAFGNPVPAMSGGTVQTAPGVCVSVSYERDSLCRYRLVVTTEKAVARDWTYSYSTSRGGHVVTVTRHVYRNWSSTPSLSAATHTVSQTLRDEVNRFGLHDAETEVSADIHTESGTREGGDLFSDTVATVTRHAQSAPTATPGLSGHAVTTVDDEVASDGLHDSTVTVETAGAEVSQVVEYTTRRNGHELSVKRTDYRNATGPKEPDEDPSKEISSSAQKNRFGLVDGSITEQDDLYETGSVRRTEDNFTATTTTSARATGDPEEFPALFATGEIHTVENGEWTDGRFDTVHTVETAKPDAWQWTWTIRRGGDAYTCYGFGYENQSAQQTPSLPSGVSNYTSNANWRKNRFGLWDGTVTFQPDFASATHSGVDTDHKVEYKYKEIEYAHKRPSSGASLHDTAPYWYRVITYQLKTDWYGTLAAAKAAVDGTMKGGGIRKVAHGCYEATKITIASGGVGAWTDGPYNAI